MAYMPIKIYKDKVEIAKALTVGGTTNIGNKIVLETADDGNAALSIAADNITVGNNITIGSDGNITANSFIGKSVSDGEGRNIVETYATKEQLSNDVGILSTNIDDVSAALSNYKTEVNDTYALKTEIPSLSGYATETFVNNNYVPTTRTINGKALTGNITLSAGDVGALAASSAPAKLTNCFTTRTVSFSVTIAAGKYQSHNTDSASNETSDWQVPTVTGYTPVGIVGNYSTSSWLNIYSLQISGSNIYYGIRNYDDASVTATVTAIVLYYKSS